MYLLDGLNGLDGLIGLKIRLEIIGLDGLEINGCIPHAGQRSMCLFYGLDGLIGFKISRCRLEIIGLDDLG
jgi:hypothetical protein